MVKISYSTTWEFIHVCIVYIEHAVLTTTYVTLCDPTLKLYYMGYIHTLGKLATTIGK